MVTWAISGEAEDLNNVGPSQKSTKRSEKDPSSCGNSSEQVLNSGENSRHTSPRNKHGLFWSYPKTNDNLVPRLFPLPSFFGERKEPGNEVEQMKINLMQSVVLTLSSSLHTKHRYK